MEKSNFVGPINIGESIEPNVIKLINEIKFQIESFYKNLDEIYDVFYSFEYGIDDYNNNGLLVKMHYLYDAVLGDLFYIYFKQLLVDLGYKIEDILFKEILVNLPEDKNFAYDSERKYRLEQAISDIFEESGLDKDTFGEIYIRAYNFKYGL